MDKLEQARRAGMLYALAIAKERGIEGLEEEIRFRNITRCPISISKGQYEKFLLNVKENTLATYTMLMASTLHDEFDFEQEQILRAIKRLEEKAECIVDGYVEADEIMQTIADEVGIYISK